MSAYRARTKATESHVDAAVAAVKAERDAEWEAAAEHARARQAARQHFTAADLSDARFVRDSFGWHEVVRVNAKSVTVTTAYSWTDRISIGNVLDVKRVSA